MSTKQSECFECKKMFKGMVGRATHMRKAHGLNPDGTKYKPKAKPKTEIVVRAKHKHTTQTGDNHGELYAYIAAKLEDTIHRVAFEHDLPERQFAIGFAQYLSHA